MSPHLVEPEAAERGAQVAFPPPLVFLGFILAGVAMQWAIAPIPVVMPRWLGFILGTVIIVIALGMGMAARLLFVRSGQHPAPWLPSPTLLLGGPYRFTRNPMYLGLALVEVGLGLAVNDLWIAIFAAPALIAVHYIAVLPEESYLTEKFGAPYRAYLTHVRRYL